MKKIVFFVLVMNCLVYGNVLGSISYKEALFAFKQKDYYKSYKMFSNLFLSDMDNLLINFYLGRSAYELKKYEFAISAYDRILISNPLNVRVRLELAQTYMQMNLLTQALKEFELVLNMKMPVQIKKRVEESISFIKSKKQKHFFDISAIYGITYDSNINSAPNSGTFNIYSTNLNSNLTLSNDGNKDETFIQQFILPTSYRYKINDKVMINSSIVPVFYKYNNYREKDIHSISFSFTPTFYEKANKYSFSFLYDFVYLGHTSYQENYYIKPSFSRVFSNDMLYEMFLKLGKVNYLKSENKNNNLIEFSNSLKYNLKDFGFIDMQILIGRESEIDSMRTDVSKNYYSLSFSHKFKFNSHYTLNTSFDYKKSLYQEKDLNFLSRRIDKKVDYSVEVQKILNKRTTLMLGTQISENLSNHEPYTYDKYTLKANIFYSF